MSRRRWSVVLAIALACAAPALAAAESAPGDVTLKRTGDDGALGHVTAVFPHWRHRVFFTCNVCHTAIFPMKAGETAVTMDDIEQGKLCGTCHNGRIAWGVGISTCGRCHTEQ
jgi:c(7)-type cytochrome triheme protein